LITGTDLLTLALVHLAGAIIPGPNVMLVAYTAISSSRHDALLASLGIATGALLWCLITLGTLAFMAGAFPSSVRRALYGVGLCYIAYLGTAAIVRGFAKWRRSDRSLISDAGKSRSASTSAFSVGIFTNLSNPKALLYFTSIFVAFTPSSLSVLAATEITATIFAVSLIWHVLVTVAFSNHAIRALYLSHAALIDIVVGAFFLLIAVSLVWGM
jgi:threonine efflux protein